MNQVGQGHALPPADERRAQDDRRLDSIPGTPPESGPDREPDAGRSVGRRHAWIERDRAQFDASQHFSVARYLESLDRTSIERGDRSLEMEPRVLESDSIEISRG